jgi:hypothetical protein
MTISVQLVIEWEQRYQTRRNDGLKEPRGEHISFPAVLSLVGACLSSAALHRIFWSAEAFSSCVVKQLVPREGIQT